jgi:nitroimidazol reductase NimA-like FMN-containing flavoprotein (pyridoxamine 5'-phosphate oxidase superfamily)
MRRKDRKITDRAEIEAIIAKAQVCRLAMADKDRPYIVPLSFGYEDNTLYFHSANTGKKIDILKNNRQVCFEFDVDCQLKMGPEACNWGMLYRSVIGYGKASFVESSAAKRQALDIIMRQYGSDLNDYPDAKVRSTVVIRVDIDRLTGKFCQ